MSPSVSILDYSIGNLFSVARAIEACGANPVLIETPEAVEQAEVLILPGVGAFADAMAGLREPGLVDALKAYATSGRPMLGICVGMQMLLETNEEFGTHQGLGLIPGSVVIIPGTGTNGQPHKIPHIGWNELSRSQGADWRNTILEGVSEGARAYFVHSFTAQPVGEQYRLADCDYNGRTISAVVRSGNLYGCQFHPEKSGKLGLQILKNFVNLHPALKTTA